MSGDRAYRDIVVKDHARQHNGDVYNGNVSIYASAPDDGSSSSRKRRRSSSSDGDSDARGVRKRLMDSLYYDGFDYRKESLEVPQPQTFEWIFDVAGELVLPEYDEYSWRPREERRLVWPSFPRWLESSDSSKQYCILGKAGSGKSTLMAWISRDQQEQTASHLRTWAGSRPVHVVTHFLFRPSADALGRNLEGLLRSLLFQVLSLAPNLHTSVFDGHKAQNHGRSTTRWPIRALKAMLKSVLYSTQQHVFCIFIDGVDEYQSEGHANDDSNSLIDYLLELQQPEHIKLCLSSRPTVSKLSNLASVSGTTLRLADLNRRDIITFVSQAISHYGGLRRPDDIVHEVCVRADGVFLWAVFAVQEMIKWAETEDYEMLLERLNRMGTQLEEIFAYMLGNAEPTHHKTLAFYVKAMKWSRMRILKEPPSVTLLVAAQEDISNWSYKAIGERCELEERRITHWSHGLLELKSARYKNDEKPDLDKSSYAWVRRTSQHIEQGTQGSPSDAEEPSTDWIVSKLDCHSQRVALFNKRRISWLHRSAFDFFFSPTSQSHTRQTNGLLSSYNDCDVTSALLRGHGRLMLTVPHECKNPCLTCLLNFLYKQADAIIRVAAKATLELGECHDDALDQVLTTLLAWKHRGPHPESASDYTAAFRERGFELYGCPFEFIEPVHGCVEDNCIVRLDLGSLRRDHTTEQVSLENDSLDGTMSEAMFWKLCVQKRISPSYTMQRCATLHKRRAGGVILACILEAMHTDPWRVLSADEMRLEAHVGDQIQLWFNRHASTAVTNAWRWVKISTILEKPYAFSSHTLVSYLPFQTRALTPGQDVFQPETTLHDMEKDDYSEGWMVAKLASIFANRPRRDLWLQLSQILAPWDICVDVGRYNDLAIMVDVTELVRINNTKFRMDQTDVASLRLMLGDFGNGRMASHWISRDIAWTICHYFKRLGTDHTYRPSTMDRDRKAFLFFAEELLQDVHRNPILLETEKTALENALCITLVDDAKFKALGKLTTHDLSWSEYQKWKKTLPAEEAEKVDCAGQAEQARLMALLSD
jgi:hypothetical protein